jgi:glycosyltransferase involved in cell wall biosynthesis
VKLIYVHANPLPSADPESLQVIQVVAALAKTTEVHLVARRGSGDALPAAVNAKRIDNAVASYYNITLPDNLHLHLLPGLEWRCGPLRLFWNFPFFLAALVRLLQVLHRLEVVDAILLRNLKLAQFLLRWRGVLRLPPLLFETHEIFTMSFQDEMARLGVSRRRKGSTLEMRERYVYAYADGIICITAHLAAMLRKRFRIRGPVLVAPDGVDLMSFVGCCGTLENLSANRPGGMIVYIGSLHHWKGVDLLLQAMQYLPEVFLRIVGGNEESLERYRDYAEALGLGDRVRFEGFVCPGRRFEYFRHADVFVLPLRPLHIASYFTSPLKLFEYMAAGKPIVASDLPAIREILQPDVNGILVAPNDAQALAAGIRRVLDDPILGRRLAEQASLDVRSYTWDERAQQIRDFIGLHWGFRCRA